MANALIVPSDPSFVEMRVAGLSLLERLAFGLGRIADRVCIARTASLPANIAGELEAAIQRRAVRPRIAWINDPADVSTEDLFVVTRPGVLDPRLGVEMKETPGAASKILACRRPNHPSPVMWYIGRTRCPAVLDALRRGQAPEEVLTREASEDFDPGHKVCEPITDETSCRSAESKVFLAARKESDTWIAKNFDRHVSLRITRLLMRLRLTPNQVTLVAFGLGMLGAVLMGFGRYATQVAGSALLVLSIIVDGCDGEVARLTFMESEFGRKLDFFLDNVVNACALFALGFGYYLRDGIPFYLWASLINAAAALASVLPVYFLFFRQSKVAIDPDRPTSIDAFSVTENIAGRDYIYIIFGLAVAGKLWLFTYLTLGGILVFLPVTLILLAIKRRRQR